jgi:hypothetical protein
VNIEDAGKADLIKIPGWPDEFSQGDRQMSANPIPKLEKVDR